ncbi:tubulin delta chain-like [Convolutriloba macropyga]|uniref:tubulin delta chain-like n=1 Tax=Convolutriloba macropyga TaxID=536237 RepID=UPI003F5210A3
MIDTEEKVVIPNLQQKCAWAYDRDAAFFGKRGAGNNWAFGYSHYGNEMTEHILNMMQRVSEKMEQRLASFFVAMSLAGGTGSGLGTKVTEAVRDAYPKRYILSEVVWPYQQGEIILQDYNTLLSLSSLSRFSDGILIHQNDAMQKVCEKRLGIKKATFESINKVIACQILGSTLPCIKDHHSSNNVGEVVTKLCSPTYKLLTAYHVPQMDEKLIDFTTLKWETLSKDLKQMYLTDSCVDEQLDWSVDTKNTRVRSVANHIVARGTNKYPMDDLIFLKDSMLYPKWFQPKRKLGASKCTNNTTGQGIFSEKPLPPFDKSMYLLSNSQANTKLIDQLLTKCWKMYSVKAYLHQYARHGVEEGDFLNCFVNLESLLKNYKKLN